MSDQKITQLRKVSAAEIATTNLLPVVDCMENTSPTGETKGVTIESLTAYVVSGGFVDILTPNHGYQSSNGLAFTSSISPSSSVDLRCYSLFPELGNQLSLGVKAQIPSNFVTQSSQRVIFGVGQSSGEIASLASSTYIGVENFDLIAYSRDGSSEVKISLPDFIKSHTNSTFDAFLTLDSSGNLNFYIDGILVGTDAHTLPATISNSHISMGNGSATLPNIDCVIYEAHVFSVALLDTEIFSIFNGGVINSNINLVSSYTSRNLNPGPTQWLDSKNGNHLLLPISGAASTIPQKEFRLIFKNNDTSSYLGNGNKRDVLPDNYVLKNAFVYSAGSPLLSVGSSASAAPVGVSETGSWNNNRVALTNATCSRTVLDISALGAAHPDKTLYIYYSASAAPCTFSFDGYVSDRL